MSQSFQGINCRIINIKKKLKLNLNCFYRVSNCANINIAQDCNETTVYRWLICRKGALRGNYRQKNSRLRSATLSSKTAVMQARGRAAATLVHSPQGRRSPLAARALLAAPRALSYIFNFKNSNDPRPFDTFCRAGGRRPRRPWENCRSSLALHGLYTRRRGGAAARVAPSIRELDK